MILRLSLFGLSEENRGSCVMLNLSRFKELYNARLLKNYGSWIYCTKCNCTVGYLCYTTYEYFRMDFNCDCGCSGSVEIGEMTENSKRENLEFIIKKNRMCCANDESPLFSVVAKNIISFGYKVECKKCNAVYSKQQ